MKDGTDETLRRFEEAFRSWSDRETGSAPAEAARRVRRSLAPNPSRVPPWSLVTVGAGLLVVLVGSLVRPPGPGPDPRSGHRGDVVTVSDDQLLLWLDAQTPLYLPLEGEESRK